MVRLVGVGKKTSAQKDIEKKENAQEKIRHFLHELTSVLVTLELSAEKFNKHPYVTRKDAEIFEKSQDIIDNIDQLHMLAWQIYIENLDMRKNPFANYNS
jgi:hypothetical protein